VEYQYFTGTDYLHLQGTALPEDGRNRFNNLLIPINQNTEHHILEDNVLDAQQHENTKLSKYASMIQYCIIQLYSE